MHLLMIGIDHKTAPVQFRERLACSAAESEAALTRLLKQFPGAQALLLSTCNRTELYFKPGDREQPSQPPEQLIRFLVEFKGAALDDQARFFVKRDADAVERLFRVAAGLESMIKGEGQVLGQVKDAYRLGSAADSCGAFLHRLCHAAFRVGKRVRTETGIGVGAVSISLAAVRLADEELGGLAGKTAAVIGAGKAAELAARQLSGQGLDSLILVNRSSDRARALARTLGAEAASFPDMVGVLSRVHVAVASTSAPHHIIDADKAARAAAGRNGEPLLLIDIAVPRDVDPAAASVPGVALRHIDDLRRIVDSNLEQREAETPAAERIVAEELAAFEQWHESRGQAMPQILPPGEDGHD